MFFLKRVIPNRADGEGPRVNVEALNRYIVETLTLSALTLQRFNNSTETRSLAVCAARDDTTFKAFRNFAVDR
jgi:hypothetical protein